MNITAPTAAALAFAKATGPSGRSPGGMGNPVPSWFNRGHQPVPGRAPLEASR